MTSRIKIAHRDLLPTYLAVGMWFYLSGRCPLPWVLIGDLELYVSSTMLKPRQDPRPLELNEDISSLFWRLKPADVYAEGGWLSPELRKGGHGKNRGIQ
jgi:hypothetical protein